MSRKTIDNIFKIPVYKSVIHRLPWLAIGLAGGVGAAKIVGSFESTLEENLILAAYIPLIVYMSDAVGTQMEAFVIRDFAIQSHMDFLKYFMRQTLVVTPIAVCLSMGLYGVNIYYLKQDKWIGVVLGLSLFAAIISSLITGLLIPYIIRKVRLDPANASGPIATIIQDLMSVTIYFYIANLMLG